MSLEQLNRLPTPETDAAVHVDRDYARNFERRKEALLIEMKKILDLCESSEVLYPSLEQKVIEDIARAAVKVEQAMAQVQSDSPSTDPITFDRVEEGWWWWRGSESGIWHLTHVGTNGTARRYGDPHYYFPGRSEQWQHAGVWRRVEGMPPSPTMCDVPAQAAEPQVVIVYEAESKQQRIDRAMNLRNELYDIANSFAGTDGTGSVAVLLHKACNEIKNAKEELRSLSIV